MGKVQEIQNIANFFSNIQVPSEVKSFYPRVLEEELVNEADTTLSEEEPLLSQPSLCQLKYFEQPQRSVDIAAVDVGTISLGTTEDGIAVAVKGAIIIQREGKYSLHKIGPKVIYISPQNAVDILKRIGESFGKPDLFIDKDKDGKEVPKERVKPLNRIQDHVRNFVERWLQRAANNFVEGGILLFDGTLFAVEWDTPFHFLEETREFAFQRGNSLIGVCKTSNLSIDGVNIAYLLKQTQRPCFMKIEETGKAIYPRSFGIPFAVRFAFGGFTFRVDVCPYIVTAEEILNRLYISTRMSLGYPLLLKLAHIEATFTKREFIELQTFACKEFRLIMHRPQDISIIFAPFRR